MAKVKRVYVDGQFVDVGSDKKTILDIAPSAESVTTIDGEFIPRNRFTSVPVPRGFETNLSTINKGAALLATKSPSPTN